jgi:hypothetical protein
VSTPRSSPPPWRARVTKRGQVDDRNPEASFTQKNGEPYFGYKAHIAVDEGSDLIRKVEKGIDDKIAYKAKRNKPLLPWQKWFNTTASRVRSGVERANATMKC